jgi:hypothetical protein
MAKDYFQDIVPPSPRKHAAPSRKDDDAVEIPIHTESEHQPRSIRNIAPPTRSRTRPIPERPGGVMRRPQRGVFRYVPWLIALLCVLLVGALLFVALRPTRVTIVPRTHVLTFAGETFTAVPAESAGLTDLPYTVATIELEDSELVPSEGMVYAEEKATGNIILYNNFQTAPLKLVRDTRFESPTGLIFRTPAEVTIPGKQGNTPGKVEITVVADQPGEQYNVSPGKFTVPGLKSTPAMYAAIYAESSAAFVGGFVGERPGVAAGALESAIAMVRGRLETEARASLAATANDSVKFFELAQIEYVSMPNASAPNGVRITQKARVHVPVFPAHLFAAAVSGSAVDASEISSVRLIPRSGFGATAADTSTQLGNTSLQFGLHGAAMLVWQVDEPAIRQALAGKDKSAFETIIAGYPSVQEASARIQPFWRKSFPKDPADIKIRVLEPTVVQ